MSLIWKTIETCIWKVKLLFQPTWTALRRRGKDSPLRPSCAASAEGFEGRWGGFDPFINLALKQNLFLTCWGPGREGARPLCPAEDDVTSFAMKLQKYIQSRKKRRLAVYLSIDLHPPFSHHPFGGEIMSPLLYLSGFYRFDSRTADQSYVSRSRSYVFLIMNKSSENPDQHCVLCL